ncbi:ABC transporter ATP-binding protein [Candidatus Sumerlaeota bacterium]|nr:ABC transporter ATP-binding protein [Candidatus Sumerlaeota bacterium]
MDTIVLSDVTKRYRVYPRPIDRLKEALTLNRRSYHREFTAVDDLSLSVPKGCTMGIIGPNGAGKSTVLKMMAGIIGPTAGQVVVHGRVASIIELGTGFHGEFSGRDNVYLSAAIMGISRERVNEVFDQIARFAELGTYINMPVKTYSSGMFVRLAFSIAIHVAPDVLLVDEALAVGDAYFAHRCLRRIREMQDRGVTVCFVSHDLDAVRNICHEAILLDRGRLIDRGAPKSIVQCYQTLVAERIARMSEGEATPPDFHSVGAVETSGDLCEHRFGTFEAEIVQAQVCDSTGRPTKRLVSGDNASFAIDVRFRKDIEDPVFGIMLRNRYGTEVFGTNSHLRGERTGSFRNGQTVRVIFRTPLNIGVGVYAVSFAVHTATGYFYDYRVDNMLIEVVGPLASIGIAALPLTIEIDRNIASHQH